MPNGSGTARVPAVAFGRDIWHTPPRLLIDPGDIVSAPVALGSLIGIIGEVRTRRAANRGRAAPLAESAPPPSYVPTSDTLPAERPKHIAALRDSGALTDREYLAAKRRIEKDDQQTGQRGATRPATTSRIDGEVGGGLGVVAGLRLPLGAGNRTVESHM